MRDNLYNVKWRYSRIAPKKHHRTYPWLPLGHNYGFTVRRDILGTVKTSQYKAYCMCGWHTDTWYGSKPRAVKMADKNHYENIKAQERFDI